MAKETKPQNGVPVEAVPHLYNAAMLKWQKAIWEGLRSIHEELEKLNKEK